MHRAVVPEGRRPGDGGQELQARSCKTTRGVSGVISSFVTRPARSESFSTLTVDVKKLIDYLVSKGYSKDLWVSRLEVGSEIDDNTKGKVSMKNVEFEVNGQKRSPVFGQ